ncbi:3'-5' exonuclease [Vagococcus xieshaowenii]|uniref:DNA polymerase III polC-type n=1 Tax=Vagococcus xieshaowenii TaxID=2562451 RepID=A0AAJ5EDA0_9ENTE|nr:3'-5' exonuclease [Vagococcus xieshaowenii]QCA29346.1 exonuclease [Vagococcus xieshaowenii]TFZ39362.1 exonuclease [Vagococcus xieshaowenii]
MNFIAMDFETANAQRHSACSIALSFVQDSQIVGKYYSLLQPDTDFHWRNIQVHGIKPEMVKNAPTFSEIWPELAQYFQSQHLVVAHNAPFDNGVLRGCLDYYGLPEAHFQSLCTVRSSRKLFPDFENHRLNTVCQHLGITLDNHHDALEDSVACANILLTQEKLFGTEPLKQFVKKI